MRNLTAIIDANEAVARVAYKLNEIIAIYPITPASVMGELSDLYSYNGEKNIFDTIPEIIEMQSEAGASGTVHGALQNGSLTTTFTASQGLLLMIPNMYKIAGELNSTVFHIAARSIASQALSIFCDHSDVMATRQTGFAILSSNSVQEAHDMALISQVATLKSRIPFLHFFDGFRTSHEINNIELIDENIMKQMIDIDLIKGHRDRGLNSDNPFIRGTSQNPDVYFQGRESVNSYYDKAPSIVQEIMDEFKTLTNREYKLFDYVGDKEATRIIILMGSGAQAVHETVEYLNKTGEKVGVVKVRLFRPFSIKYFINSLPKTTKSIAVLDRTKEPGSVGEPLYLDIVNALNEAKQNDELQFDIPMIVGGRYGLSSKEFTPAMIKSIFDELKKDKPKNHFTIGINDDLTYTSLEYNKEFVIKNDKITEAIFFGLGSDGTVGANKNSIKIIGTHTNNYVQGYFVYDSKKSGSMTTSHLRFGSIPIRSTYLIKKADFIASHQNVFLEKFDILQHAKKGATFLLNTSFSKEEVWDHLSKNVQKELIEKEIKFYIVNAYKIAKETKLGRKINTIMQTCFFVITNLVPKNKAIEYIKQSVEKTYGKKSDEIVNLNFKAIDEALNHLYKVDIPLKVTSTRTIKNGIKGNYSEFISNVTAHIIELKGDEIAVSQMPADGTWPSGTTQYEKRNIALEVPVWDPLSCIQCNKCILVCPHAVIRSKLVDNSYLDNAPFSFKSIKAKGKNFTQTDKFTIQVAIEDCTGCSLCTEVCPGVNKTDKNLKAINMSPQFPLKKEGIRNWDYFLELPYYDRDKLNHLKVKDSQFLEPLFEFSAACSGCGETPYIKLATQLFGDRMIVANATGCSSIYGGNLPTTPWSKNSNGKGPAWSNSLFEDNAEFGLGFRLSVDKHEIQAKELLSKLSNQIDKKLLTEILNATQSNEAEIFKQRDRVEKLKIILKGINDKNAIELLTLVDYLVKKSVWIIGGDGWAYDIGYGGLDHTLSTGKNVNILVLDTQVYSNTGGQQSKATPTGAVAKFASGGKQALPKDLAMMAITYGNVYVARVAMGASDTQTIKAFIEAEAYDGPSLIIAYSHCIAHGYDLKDGMKQQKLAVDCGLWPLIRYNPELVQVGENPMKLDYKGPQIPVENYMYNETRFKMVKKMNKDNASQYLDTATAYAQDIYKRYISLTTINYKNDKK